MDLKQLQSILAERKLTAKELKKREEIAQAIERENPGIDMSKKMAIATAKAKEVYQESESLNEISEYDLVVTYYRSLGLDPYKLRGATGNKLREQIKNSPAYHAWKRSMHYESVMALDESTARQAKDIDKDLLSWGFVKREGSRHTVYKHPKSSHPKNNIAVPRHAKEVSLGTVKQIYKNAHTILQDLNPIKESKAEKVVKLSKKCKNPDVLFYSMPKADSLGTPVDQPSIENDTR